MIRAAEILAGFYGSVLLAKRRTEGLELFDATPRGFWRSFWAVGMIALPLLLLEGLHGVFAGNTALAVLIRAIAMVIEAVAFPLAMASVARELGHEDRYIRFVVAYNWSSLVRVAALFPVALITAALPQFQPLLLAVLALSLLYEGYIAHVALEVGPGMSAAIVLLDVLIEEAVGFWSKGLMAAG
jgi:hypothetical protein